LHTVCEEAKCPNRGRCLGDYKSAAFLLMGPGCSRRCGFCAVAAGVSPLDASEPARVARAVGALGLDYVVLTAPGRDDPPDGGAGHIAAAARAVKKTVPSAEVEVLAPDFGGDAAAAELVATSGVAVFAHNIETVPRLYSRVRPAADYKRSLAVLGRAAATGIVTKSSLMVGLGECEEEIRAAFADLRRTGVSIVTVGQYLRPSRGRAPVARFWPAAAFWRLAAGAAAMGFAAVACGPFVRSSYRARDLYRRSKGGPSASTRGAVS